MLLLTTTLLQRPFLIIVVVALDKQINLKKWATDLSIMRDLVSRNRLVETRFLEKFPKFLKLNRDPQFRENFEENREIKTNLYVREVNTDDNIKE